MRVFNPNNYPTSYTKIGFYRAKTNSFRGNRAYFNNGIWYSIYDKDDVIRKVQHRCYNKIINIKDQFGDVNDDIGGWGKTIVPVPPPIPPKPVVTYHPIKSRPLHQLLKIQIGKSLLLNWRMKRYLSI